MTAPPDPSSQAGRPQGRAPGDWVRAHAVVSGFVQGVCYRAETRYEAEGLAVTGWVRNRSDGTVELVAEGPRENVEKLIAWCRRGPEYARVEDVEVKWEKATGEFSRFGISR